MPATAMTDVQVARDIAMGHAQRHFAESGKPVSPAQVKRLENEVHAAIVNERAACARLADAAAPLALPPDTAGTPGKKACRCVVDAHLMRGLVSQSVAEAIRGRSRREAD